MTMRTIVLANSKAGTGKSTLVASLAVAAAAAGEKVIALDLDPQGSLANWGETRAAWCAANDLVVDHVDGARLTQLPQILAALDRRGFTVAILDTAGVDSTGGNLAMRAAALCLVPARPTRVDLAATLSTVQALLRLELRTGSRSCSTNVRPDAARARPKPPRDWARSAPGRAADRRTRRPSGRTRGRAGRHRIRSGQQGGGGNPRLVGLDRTQARQGESP